MGKKQGKTISQHPLLAYNDLIESQGAVVIDGVKEVPLSGEPFTSPHLVVVICHSGYVKNYYDTNPVEYRQHDYAVVYPDHILQEGTASPDYECTLIAISKNMLHELQHLSPRRYQLEYMRVPGFHLTDEQYENAMNCLTLLRTITKTRGADRRNMLIGMLDVMSQLIDYYRFNGSNTPTDPSANKQVFYKFYDDLVHHYHESHEVRFYAKRMCLTPKYFATLIKRETGTQASTWIARYIITQAKSLLRNSSLDVQQVSTQLGFTEQSSFSRFFKTHTGMSPSEYRRQRD